MLSQAEVASSLTEAPSMPTLFFFFPYVENQGFFNFILQTIKTFYLSLGKYSTTLSSQLASKAWNYFQVQIKSYFVSINQTVSF